VAVVEEGIGKFVGIVEDIAIGAAEIECWS
jgi:hypothetical protein